MRARASRLYGSLYARIAATVVLFFLAGVWLLALVQSGTQEARLRALLEAQHSSIAGYVAADIGNKIRLRLNGLAMIAARFPAEALEDRAVAQSFLGERRAIYNLFDGGLVLLSADGTTLLSQFPEVAGRTGRHFEAMAIIREMAVAGAPAIGQPDVDPVLGKPALVMAAPIRRDGRVAAVLAGIVTLGAPNLLDLVANQRLGETGEFVVAAPRHGVTVAGGDPSRALQPLPPKGANPLLDRYLEGWEGAGVGGDGHGGEDLSAARRVPVADWIVVARTPTAEALAPVREARLWSFGGAAAVSVAIGLLTALFVRRSLAPLRNVSAELAAVASGAVPLHPLPLPGAREIDQVVDSYNRLQATLQAEEQDLAHSREQLQLAIENSAMGLWDWRIDTGERSFNERWAGILGYTLAEMRPLDHDAWWERCHPDDRDAIEGALGRHLRGETPAYECEYRMRHRSGEWVWVLGRGKVVEWDEAHKPRRMIGTHVDITPRKRLEARLREGEARFRAVANAAPVLIWVAGTGKLHTWFNEVWLDFTGRSLDQEVGMGWAEGVHPDDRERVLDVFDDHFDRRVPFTVEFRLRRGDGQWRWLLDNGVPRFGDDGEFLGFIGSGVDITEQRERDAVIQRQAEELQRSNAELEQFAYVASHDLRQPLRMVSSFMTLLQRKLGDTLDEDGRSYLQYAVDGAKRMDALIHDLLEYSRVGRLDGAARERLALDAVAAEAVANLAVDIEETGARVEVRAPLPVVEGNRTECLRLLQNLIGNAIKYRRPGVAPEVTVSAADGGAEWVLSVADNGIGVPEDARERIFGIFQRLVTQDEYEGTGIGLAICRKIAAHHGGRIWVESVPGSGSTFKVALPKVA